MEILDLTNLKKGSEYDGQMKIYIELASITP